ncbi:xanthine dehydrogenase family protein molybdopterin-binding subunit [Acuticoccus mangrovi]|uniref:Xanthine dehydrogenase family protein molybdopterin-binding subunit n=1 Tax=Acuticoccus mangrovi TaxID=2796142 RepID=A0A934IPL2_9HYPH|nr:xanthine dehydrogenase family protein molybdopterin-binding subunit [Acuticoccus mangrovi]MBJ3775725.1 xanthine dehydrogenase family protein molybdopterin-binding subunit [Acuticoccus mangrovi]
MNDMTMAKFGMGASALRVEDRAFITGHGHYVDDYRPEGTLYAVMVRSPIAAGTFTINDIEAAREAPGVKLVLTHDDVTALNPLPCRGAATQEDGSETWIPTHYALAKDTVRHVGDSVAMVVAETLAEALDAAELIDIDWASTDCVTDTKAALEDGAPLVWPEHGSNLAFRYATGDKAATEAAFAKAHKVAKLELINNRVVTNYMEPRGAVGEYDPATDRFTLTAATQGGHGMRNVLSEILKIEEAKLRVVTPDVGGGFGTKIFVYVEYPLLLLAAKATGKPVKWTCGRSEAFLADSQGRDNVTTAELAMDESGKFLALRVDLKAAMGGYLAQFGPYIPNGGSTMSTGVYDIPALYCAIKGIYTNTLPTDAYRGAGRPEASYTIERLVDEAARVMGIDRLELRRRNFVKPEQMPYTTAAGRIYDTGEFDGHMTRALEVADWDGFAARAKESAAKGLYRGIGLSTYIEACAFPGSERAELQLGTTGKLTLLIGTQSNGQGHATAYTQIIAEHLGIDPAEIEVIQGDTDRVKTGGGTGGSRSIPLGLPSVDAASIELANKLKELASDKLEAAPEDLEISDGAVRVVGTDRSVTFGDLGGGAPISAAGQVKQDQPTFPNGTHVCELVVDPATGIVSIERYVIVDDYGVAVNPVLLEGQVHGGTAQGIGQALLEHTVYDDEGQLITASLLDYAMPRAEDIPFFHFEMRNVPSKHNAFGIKGAGEAGSIGSCGAVMNAVVDAVSRGCGVTHVNMPATPSVLWQTINDATAKAA